MAFNQKKSVTYRLVQATKAYRQRSANVLAEVNLHPGQDQILKALSEDDGQTMGALALALSVQPPTITKMVARLSAQGLVERRQSDSDGRSSSVYLTASGGELIEDLDRRLKRMEKAALKGLEDKERKRLRKVLRHIERNLSSDMPVEASELDNEDANDVDANDLDFPSATPTAA